MAVYFVGSSLSLVKSDSVPFLAVKSSKDSPSTSSLNLIVTVDVSLFLSALSLIVISAVGAVVSIVTSNVSEYVELPALSVDLTLIECLPSAKSLEGVKLQLPSSPAVAVPRDVSPSNTSTLLPASAVPLRVGVLSFVILSLLLTPLSLSSIKSIVGFSGAVVSIVTVRDSELSLLFPARSVALAVSVCSPSLRALSSETVKLQLPSLLAVAVPRNLSPSNTSTVLPASAVPINVGFVTFVILSSFLTPLSLLSSKSIVGLFGAVLSMMTLPIFWMVSFPAISIVLTWI